VRGFYKDDFIDEIEYAYEDAHAVVKVDNDMYEDVDGISSKQELIDRCLFINDIEYVEIVPITPNELKYAFAFASGVSEREIKETIEFIKLNRN
jgi:hypothetical protein